jgi:CARDB
VPSQAGSLTGTGDITVRFAETGDILYAGILRLPGFLRLNILRSENFLGAAVMTVLVDRPDVDQPYVQATTVAGNDRVYVGLNDFAAAPQTATVDLSVDAQTPLPPGPTFTSARIESRGTSGQDGPPIRVAIHPDGTIYAIFNGWRAFDGTNATTDVVVVRDDNGGTGAAPFTALVDVDGLAGMRVVQGRIVPFRNFPQPDFGQERFVASNISIAVDPANSSTVYIAWADLEGDDYTLHVRRSADRGATWTLNDLRTIANATNPALAVNDRGMVGFLYQEVVRSGVDQRWVTHLELTEDGFASVQDFILANVPAMAPPPIFIPYIGDYVHLMAVGSEFHGIFSANNTPDLANFPNGVTYQRNADFTTKTLLDNNNQPVQVSIDPFHVRLTPPTVQPTTFEYAAKFICGLQKDPEDPRLTRGFYATEINIHNPNETEVKFKKKLALTYPPEAQRPGKIYRISEDVLGPDEALAVDCGDVERRLFPGGLPAPYIIGFIVIESPASLDVTAVYTVAALDRAGRVTNQSGIDVEQIRERRKGGDRELPDLVPVPDRTGSFCRRRDGKLVVTVKNQGSGHAQASTTQVDFFAHGQVPVPTPPLAPNASTDLLVDIPPGCFDPDCNFRITVDIDGVVAESNESNNTADGVCLG